MMFKPLAFVGTFFFKHATVYGQYASRFPEPIPLFHKSPYFNVWLPANDSMYIPGNVSFIMPNGLFVDWTIAVRVDGVVYLLQDEEPKFVAAKTVGVYITSTRTVLTMDAGPLRVNMTYLTPIELDNWILHSLPFIYFTVNIWSTDGQPHAIQLYSGIGGMFLSATRDNKMTWNTTITSKSIYHRAQQSIVQTLTEINDMSEDGTQYFATGLTPGATVTWQVSSNSLSRSNFTFGGKLTNTSETKFRSISSGWPCMAFALDFGTTSQIPSPPVFALGLVRDPVMRYVKDGTQTRSSLWWLRWSNVGQAIDTFLANFPSALSRAIALDNKIVSDTSVISSKINLPSAVAVNLTDLMILSLRQTIGSLEFTTLSSNGESADNWRVFMKDFGNTRRINPVDILYESFPAFLYLDPPLAGKLLEPLLEFQASDSAIYAAHDLGITWPAVLGNSLDEYYFGVDNCGSMLVMVLAHAQKSGDGKLIVTYYDLLRKWADFLVTNSLQLNDYTIAVDAVANVTSNVELKGIMGIWAMAQINKALNRNPEVTAYYLNTAMSQLEQWQSLLLSTDHVTSIHGNTSSWGLLFNLYAPRLLGTDIIPEMIYETQAKWYNTQIAQAPTFGLPVDSSQPALIKAPLTLFTAASIFNSTTSNARDALIGMVHSRSFPMTAVAHLDANPSIYSADSGTPSGIANPAMGAAFAFLALDTHDMDIVLPSGPPLSSLSLPSVLGGVLGGVAGLILVLVIIYFLFKKWKKLQGGTTSEHHSQAFHNIDGTMPPETMMAINEIHPFVPQEVTQPDSTAALPFNLPQRYYENYPTSSGKVLSTQPNPSGTGRIMTVVNQGILENNTQDERARLGEPPVPPNTIPDPGADASSLSTPPSYSPWEEPANV